MNCFGTRCAPKLCFAVVASLLASAACARLHGTSFRVVPATPAYLLRSPDSHTTPFPEILRSYNDFAPGRGWVDLRPGMELRIENAYYQPGMPRRGLNGFLGTEVARYKVRSRGGLQLLSTQSMKDRPSGDLPVQQLIRPSETHDASYRFYYEILFRSGDTRGSVLLSANTNSEMNRIADELRRDPDSVCGERSRKCTVFPEACSVSIEMEIVVNGTPQNELWGRLLSDIVDQSSDVDLSRIYNGRLVPVKFDAHDPDALRLPLLPGDHVKWSKR
jgi:hypothetical protein